MTGTGLAGRVARSRFVGAIVALALGATALGLAGAPTPAQAATSLEVLAGWTTYFTPSDHNGWGANIWIPARTLDGHVVGPGQRFDFWTAIGPITWAKGYRIGGAIVGGHTREGVALGGGICAASSTLFNAAYRAGLPINARYPHYYYIERYPVGLDATVSSSQGMAWTNDTMYPVVIRGFTGSGSIRFELHSFASGRTVSISRPSVTNYRNARTTYTRTSALPDGARRRIEYTIDGFDAAVTRTVRNADGAVIRQETTRSRYHRVDGIIYVGDRNAPWIPVPAWAPRCWPALRAGQRAAT